MNQNRVESCRNNTRYDIFSPVVLCPIQFPVPPFEESQISSEGYPVHVCTLEGIALQGDNKLVIIMYRQGRIKEERACNISTRS